jgi:hypothetical protein
MKKALFFMVMAVLVPIESRAVRIGEFPGLGRLAEHSDAIVVLRIDRHINIQPSPTLYSTHECYIYQTLKGDIPKGERIALRLMDTRSSFVTPFALHSTHLMFLTRKRTEDEPTEYRTIEFQGANMRLSPFGHEIMPEGRTLEDKVKFLIKRSMEYWDDQHRKEQEFLRAALRQPGLMPKRGPQKIQLPGLAVSLGMSVDEVAESFANIDFAHVPEQRWQRNGHSFLKHEEITCDVVHLRPLNSQLEDARFIFKNHRLVEVMLTIIDVHNCLKPLVDPLGLRQVKPGVFEGLDGQILMRAKRGNAEKQTWVITRK